MTIIDSEDTGKTKLLMGNEAIARGALEAGVKVCTAYPGTPSSDIIANLAQVANKLNLYVEWSSNEKVALEVAASAALSGQRSICAMKQNGLNVASDFLLNFNLIGIEGSMVLVTCDDPSGHSSTNEQDSRSYAKIADLPLLEPATFQEAKDMTKWAFKISEDIKNVCMIRGVTRISHARGNVTLGSLTKNDKEFYFDKSKQRITFPIMQKHKQLHRKLEELERIFIDSPFNRYDGPDNPKYIIITCGSSWLYSLEAVEILNLKDIVGILKIGTSWPLPKKLIVKYLKKAKEIIIIEEVDSFLEGNVKEIAADAAIEIGTNKFYGKSSKHIPYVGETTTDRVIEALSNILDIKYEYRSDEYEEQALNASKIVPIRSLGFCPGCPHRASYWSIKNALKLDNREGFVTGDIGCYHLARTPAGYNLLKTSGAMGTGTGLASGFGKFHRYGFKQPVISVCGDSTFFHAAMPALANAVYSGSNIVMAILDNSATAMTGFQPHPGIEKNAMGEDANPIDIEKVCRAFGAKVEVTDPYNLLETQEKILNALEDPDGTKVIIMRKPCALLSKKRKSGYFKIHVESQKCIGEKCGCNKLCTKSFKCPGLFWNKETARAEIDDVICIGCGVCADICPENAIIKQGSLNK